jgi:hypothetical protein
LEHHADSVAAGDFSDSHRAARSLFDSPPTPPMIGLVRRFSAINATPGSFGEQIQIGGLVLRLAGDVPIAGATVLRTATGEQATTDSQGRFSFAGLLRALIISGRRPPGLRRLSPPMSMPRRRATDERTIRIELLTFRFRCSEEHPPSTSAGRPPAED